MALSSGMGAVGVTLLALVESGDTVLAADALYGGTNLLLRQHLTRLGISVEVVDATDLDAVENAIESQPKVMLIKSITNPLLSLPNVKAIVELAHKRGTALVIDRPLESGADVVIHSGHKEPQRALGCDRWSRGSESGYRHADSAVEPCVEARQIRSRPG